MGTEPHARAKPRRSLARHGCISALCSWLRPGTSVAQASGTKRERASANTPHGPGCKRPQGQHGARRTLQGLCGRLKRLQASVKARCSSCSVAGARGDVECQIDEAKRRAVSRGFCVCQRPNETVRVFAVLPISMILGAWVSRGFCPPRNAAAAPPTCFFLRRRARRKCTHARFC